MSATRPTAGKWCRRRTLLASSYAAASKSTLPHCQQRCRKRLKFKRLNAAASAPTPLWSPQR
eukprot:12636217-Prorocentrum_lima.AAC.1